jgi:hypothetical protein
MALMNFGSSAALMTPGKAAISAKIPVGPFAR